MALSSVNTPDQRWRTRRSFFVKPEGERFNPSWHEVHVIDRCSAKAFVEQHHYSGSYTSNRVNVGLFRKGMGLVGVAVFGNPCNNASAKKYFQTASGEVGHRQVVELTRFVLLDEVEWNAESWFLARAKRLLLREKEEVCGLLSYSDPLPRRREDGSVILPGHTGTIYQATNGVFVGRSESRKMILTRDGLIVSRRMLGKIRFDQRGVDYAYEQFRRLGAPARLPLESGEDYVARALRESDFRTTKHPGNLVYTWAMTPALSTRLEPLPYPKAELLAA